MTHRQDFKDVMEKRKPARVPLWELHFHLWQKLSQERFISGERFLALPFEKQRDAIFRNASILAKWGEKLHFSAVSLPDEPWDCLYTLPQEWRLELSYQLRQLKPDFYQVAGCSGVLSMPDSSDDYLDFCYRLFDAPAEIDETCAHLFKAFTAKAQALKESGVEAIYIPADVADNRNVFFSPPQLQRWYLPWLSRAVQKLKDLGLYAILHTDGMVRPILPQLRESGIDALQSIDPVAGMDLAETKRILRDVAVCGNIDCGLMLTGQPQEVRDATAKTMREAKPDGRFILGCTNAVDIKTPWDNYEAMLQTFCEHRGYDD